MVAAAVRAYLCARQMDRAADSDAPRRNRRGARLSSAHGAQQSGLRGAAVRSGRLDREGDADERRRGGGGVLQPATDEPVAVRVAVGRRSPDALHASRVRRDFSGLGDSPDGGARSQSSRATRAYRERVGVRAIQTDRLLVRDEQGLGKVEAHARLIADLEMNRIRADVVVRVSLKQISSAHYWFGMNTAWAKSKHRPD